MDTANAQPQKRLFLELITRDITLEDAILDLIDNSLNSILQREQINLTESFDEILSATRMPAKFAKYKVDISIDEKSFQLIDNCGGIGYEAARTVVFQFGRASAVS